jgi:hypothetical protein
MGRILSDVARTVNQQVLVEMAGGVEEEEELIP